LPGFNGNREFDAADVEFSAAPDPDVAPTGTGEVAAAVGVGVGVICEDADCLEPALDDVELLQPARQAAPQMIATMVTAP
jgi:hypothetical protein